MGMGACDENLGTCLLSPMGGREDTQICALFLWQQPLAPPQQGTLFTGSTLRWFGLTIWDNAQAHTHCRTECAKDADCRGYTFVVIGGFNPQ